MQEGDGGSGDWAWDATSAAADDTGLAIDPVGHTGPGRWIRQIPGNSYNAAWWGMVPDSASASAANSAAMRAAMSEALRDHRDYDLPCGRYYHAGGPILPLGSGIEYRGDAIHLRGCGSSPAFVVAAYAHGTDLIGTTDAACLTFRDYTSNHATGHIEVSDFRCEGATSKSPLMYFQTLSEYSWIHDIDLLQYGTGGGFRCDDCYKATLERMNVLGASWMVRGPATRTGTAFDIQVQHDGGLFAARSLTARGFNLGFNIGNGTNNPSATRFEQVESSTNTNGWVINPGVGSAVLEEPYFEDTTGTCVRDEGRGTKVGDGHFYTGCKVGIDARFVSECGNVYSGNYIELNAAGGTGIVVAADAGQRCNGKAIRDNHIIFGSSGRGIANVVGIKIEGNSPRLDCAGNAFDPGEWTGGAGTKMVLDVSTGRGGSCDVGNPGG